MNWWRRVSALTLVLVGLGALAAAEVGGVIHYRAVARKTGREFEWYRREMRALATLEPAPTSQNVAFIEADIRRLSETLATRETQLLAVGAVADRFMAVAVPARRPDTFFEIAALVEALRTRAQQAGVTVKPDERFGFSAYTHEAPASDQIAGVFRDGQMVQYLVETLIDAKPHELLSMQRERPREKAPVVAPGSAAGPARRQAVAAADGDYFTMDPRLSAREASGILTRAFRLSFTGHTATLRTLLNKLAAYELPLIVRSVEVAPPDRPTAKAVGPDSAALVAPSWSRFTVTIELIDLPNAPLVAS